MIRSKYGQQQFIKQNDDIYIIFIKSIFQKICQSSKVENFLSTPKKVFILIKQQDLVERDTLVSIRKVNQLKKQKINSAIIKVPL